MKKFLVLVVMAFLTLMVSSVAFAREPQSPDGVNTFTVSPDPAAAGSSVTIAINVNMTAGADNTTAFCLYAPDTAVGTFPSPITLSYSSGFTTTPVDFTAATGTCPARTGQTSRVYTSPATLPSGDSTYEGNASFTIASGATAGTYDWTLLLQEPGGGVNPLSYSHEIEESVTPDDGLRGTIIDTKTSAPWAYGAEILVTQMTGDNAGRITSAIVQSDGTWVAYFFAPPPPIFDPLGLCQVNCNNHGNNPATYKVDINYRCDLEVTTTGIRPSFTSSTDSDCPITFGGTSLTGLPENFDFTVPDTNSGGIQDVGNIQTVTGPTAVSLQTVTADNNSTAIGIGFVVLMLAGVTFVMFRRREVA